MPPRTRSSGALVRMNPTREDEAYTKEVLRKTSDGFRAELTSGKSERITQNLRNQDEGTLRLQEYLMAAEVDARPPKKIDTLMDQSDALKLQKSLTALQVAPIQRSRVQEPPKYEITSEDKDSSSSRPQQASLSETSSTSTPPESSPTPSPPLPPPARKSPKDVPKPATPTPLRQSVTPVKKPSPAIQPSQEDEYTDEYVMIKQRVKRKPRPASKLSTGARVVTAGEPGMLYAYKKAWGCAEYVYASTCGVLALMVLFIFSYLLMRLWTGCAGLGVVGTGVPLVPMHTSDGVAGVSCTGPSLKEIQSLLELNNKVLLKEWSNARTFTLDNKEIHEIATQVASKLSDQHQKLELRIAEIIDKHTVRTTSQNITTNQLKDLAKIVRDEVTLATKERISTLSDAIAKFEKEMLSAQSATTNLMRDLLKNNSFNVSSTSAKKASEKIKTAVEKMSDAADAAVTAGSANFTALFTMIENLSSRLETSYRNESITKELQALQQSILLDIQTQLKDAAAATNQVISDSLASIRTQTESLSTVLIDLAAKSAVNAEVPVNGTAPVMFASESLNSMQHAIDKIIVALGELSDRVGSSVGSTGSYGGSQSSSLTLADLEEVHHKLSQHITQQAQNVTLAIQERMDASERKVAQEVNERVDHLKIGIAGIIKKALLKQTGYSSESTSAVSRGIVDDLRLQYTDFTKQSFGTRIAGKSDDIANIAESLKTLISGNERVRLMFNDNMSPGACWPTKKNGHVVLRFKDPVTLYYGTISHPAAPKLSTGRTTVPRDLTFIGRTTTGKEIQLGSFTFDVDGPEQQAFQLQENHDLIQVRVQFANNGGEYTCIYNLGLFGEKDSRKL
ncbi:Hypothetical protein GLP15_2585 [Giardia lamblia P15]|uniref:SUN domain-containing protein n=1 Tax=Giardia intestinalis (strain P15) TaxID=658858 RepID=E1EXQ4_GIAIA|nr:Hypothetical protein GLP15_2585 [Giardia lamblia P15]